MEAIYRVGQPARQTALRLAKENNQKSLDTPKHVDISKNFGEATEWAEELKIDIQGWREGTLSWSEVGKGCLLHGVPGTGKTQFVAALAAKCDMHLEVASIAKWQGSGDGALGDMLKAMHRSFASAKENTPCLLFIDEFDSIGDRSTFPARHQHYSTQVVNGLLACLDGIEGREGVIVVGACNFPERVDDGLRRGGRLETQIHIPLPNAGARADILGFYLPTLADEPELKQIAARLPEKTGSALEMLSRDARRIARRERRPVTIDDLQSKIEPLPVLSEMQQFRVAVHEAGHALVAHMLSLGKVARVEIFDNVHTFATEADAFGMTVIEYPVLPFDTKRRQTELIAMHLAGAAAEEIVFKDRSTMSSGREGSDFAKATSIAVNMVTKYGFGSTSYFLPGSVDTHSPSDLWRDQRLEEEVSSILEIEYLRVKEMLTVNQLALVAFAAELGIQKRLEGKQLEKFLSEAMPSDDGEKPKH
jgi:cell division protease FtsH